MTLWELISYAKQEKAQNDENAFHREALKSLVKFETICKNKNLPTIKRNAEMVQQRFVDSHRFKNLLLQITLYQTDNLLNMPLLRLQNEIAPYANTVTVDLKNPQNTKIDMAKIEAITAKQTILNK